MDYELDTAYLLVRTHTCVNIEELKGSWVTEEVYTSHPFNFTTFQTLDGKEYDTHDVRQTYAEAAKDAQILLERISKHHQREIETFKCRRKRLKQLIRVRKDYLKKIKKNGKKRSKHTISQSLRQKKSATSA